MKTASEDAVFFSFAAAKAIQVGVKSAFTETSFHVQFQFVPHFDASGAMHASPNQ